MVPITSFMSLYKKKYNESRREDHLVKMKREIKWNSENVNIVA